MISSSVLRNFKFLTSRFKMAKNYTSEHKLGTKKASENVLSKVEGKIHKITLNRPSKRNAMSYEMYDTVASALEEAAKNDTTVAVITGTGEYFSSGNDLSNFQISSTTDLADLARQGGVVLKNFVKCFIDFPKPLICLANGPVVGIWVSVLPLFDAVYCADNATFYTPFSLLGQTPEGCSSYTFPRLMGVARANQILMFNKKLPAVEAKNLGLVSEVYPNESFERDAWEKVRELSELYPETLKDAKYVIRNSDRDVLHSVNERECKVLMRRWLSEECLTAVMNFLTRKAKL